MQPHPPSVRSRLRAHCPRSSSALIGRCMGLRSMAAEAPGQIGPAASAHSVPALVAAMRRDENRSVRRCAARALGVIRDTAAVPALVAGMREDEVLLLYMFAATIRT